MEKFFKLTAPLETSQITRFHPLAKSQRKQLCFTPLDILFLKNDWKLIFLKSSLENNTNDDDNNYIYFVCMYMPVCVCARARVPMHEHMHTEVSGNL